MVCHKTFYCKSTLNSHVKNIRGDRGEKDVCGEALSIDIPRQREMDEFDDPRQSGGYMLLNLLVISFLTSLV